MFASATSFSVSNSLKTQPRDSSFIFTEYSPISPSLFKESPEAVLKIGTTPSYTSGQSRLFNSTSRWQKWWRFSNVLKSAKPKFTGFFTLKTNGEATKTQEMCV